jgi:hypothetical protein
MNIDPFLQDLEERIDADEEERLLREWRDFAGGRTTQGAFFPRRLKKSPPRLAWPAISINRTLDDMDAMLLAQYRGCSDTLSGENGTLMCVRSNYGTGIMPLLFGAELFVMEERLNTLPTAKAAHAGHAALRALAGQGVPDIRQGFGARVLEAGARFRKVAQRYPKIGRYVHIYHPDLQGPMDVCEMVWGSSIFLDIYDQPDLVKQLLGVITETYIVFMNAWQQVVPFESPDNVHWGMRHRGNLMLRDDSAMNFSPEMFAEFIGPYDQRLLDEFGGGAIHFCGKGDHYIHHIGAMRGVYAINLSQPEYNDMETIYCHTVDRDIRLVGLPKTAADQAAAQGRDLRGRAQAWVV